MGMDIYNVGNTPVTNNYISSIQNNKNSGTDFSEAINKVYTDGNVSSSKSTAYEGDMIVPQPPNYNGIVYNNAISQKSKEEMTMSEYKQWFMNEMSQIPVSSWVRATFTSGALVITEEAFEKMKSDPEWEKNVLNMIRRMYSVNGLPVGGNHVGYQVIGASPEECYGYAGPVHNKSLQSDDDDESWWQKRHEKIEEMIEEQIKKGLQMYRKRSEAIQKAYLNQKSSNQEYMSNFLSEIADSEMDVSQSSPIQSMMAAISAYKKIVEIYSE